MVEKNIQLIERTQRYWKSRTGEDISLQTAEEYLHAFGDLYSAFIALMQPKDDMKDSGKVEAESDPRALERRGALCSSDPSFNPRC
jgi:hypothetical protein